MGFKGSLFMVSAPSGAGKTTLVRAILDRFDQLSYSISHTTRAPRKGEVDGKDYFFLDEKQFETMIEKGMMLEWARVHNNFYGTSRPFVEDQLGAGRHILLDIDVQGARQIMDSGLEPVSIFIMPPSMEELARRLRARQTDSDQVIQMRLDNARHEMEQRGFYDHLVVNDKLDLAVETLAQIFEKELQN
ncbi:MAG: guanylate kinase [Desulfobacter sp.]|nr:guanylate kinase [Desulfobacter sp.]WDP86535.1 MAG: guanylate kinase [Desulfobacter sp.]